MLRSQRLCDKTRNASSRPCHHHPRFAPILVFTPVLNARVKAISVFAVLAVMRASVWAGAALIATLAWCAAPVGAAALTCSDFNGGSDGSYWTDVANCTVCVQAGCGFCLSTLQCADGDMTGPSDGSPCPSWVMDAGMCPGKAVANAALSRAVGARRAPCRHRAIFMWSAALRT